MSDVAMLHHRPAQVALLSLNAAFLPFLLEHGVQAHRIVPTPIRRTSKCLPKWQRTVLDRILQELQCWVHGLRLGVHLANAS